MYRWISVSKARRACVMIMAYPEVTLRCVQDLASNSQCSVLWVGVTLNALRVVGDEGALNRRQRHDDSLREMISVINGTSDAR